MELVHMISALCALLPVALGHGHGEDNAHDFGSEIHNAEHIMKHLEDQIATKSKDNFTSEELTFYYFSLHDHDKNRKLDGLEIRSALYHDHDESEKKNVNGTEKHHEEDVLSDDDQISGIDGILEQYDKNLDGFIEYTEYKQNMQNHD